MHRDFCEVAICERGRARSVGRIDTTRDALELFASSLAADDRVVLESTGNALAIANILRDHVADVVLANPMQVRAISHAKVKNDRVDARTLAELLAADLLPQVWVADEATRVLRRLTSRRTQLVRQRTRTKNEISAVLVRNLIARPDVSDLFGKAGRRWMATLVLPVDERHTLDGCLRQVDFLGDELAVIDGAIAERVLASSDMRRLLTIPGVDATTAATMMATIGRIERFPTPRQLVGYVGLDARVRQSGNRPARHGRISKQGASAARHVLVQAAWAAIKTPGPLHAFYRRIKARRGAQIAIVAVARKLTILAWHLLTKQQDYAHQRPVLVARKLRRLELQTGAPRRSRRRTTDDSPDDRRQRPDAHALLDIGATSVVRGRSELAGLAGFRNHPNPVTGSESVIREGGSSVRGTQRVRWYVRRVYVEPSEENARRLSERRIEGPVTMLNLLRFREQADYTAFPHLAPPEPISGRDAYDRYVRHTIPFLTASGGSLEFFGTGGYNFVGPPDERWDLVMLVRQSSVDDLFAFASDYAYLAGVGHRTAALEDSRLIPVVERALP